MLWTKIRNSKIAYSVFLLSLGFLVATGIKEILNSQFDSKVSTQEPSYTPPIVIDMTESIHCLATNIYFEARNQSTAGQIAVAAVVMNRLKEGKWAHSICDIVYDGPMVESPKTKSQPNLPADERIYMPVRNKCQFSWYCDGKPDIIDYNSKSWIEAINIAEEVITVNDYEWLIKDANHFHAASVNPKWGKKMKFIVRIDDHLFYRR